MTAMIGGADCGPACLAVTRGGWHRVAEHMPAAALCRAIGQIGLVPSPGDFRTASCGTDARFLGVDGTELAVGGAAGTMRTPVIAVRAAAEFAGVTPGVPAGVYQPAALLDLDAPLMTGPGTGRLLAEWHGLGTQALSRFAAGSPGGKPAGPVLWPEHFDTGMTAAAIGYGTSPAPPPAWESSSRRGSQGGECRSCPPCPNDPHPDKT